MYLFCHQRGLYEVWGYMWNQWYSQHQWKLWARSSSGTHISRMRTTMTTENFWKQLKHDFLHYLVHPCLDQLVWILITQVYPAYMACSEKLEDGYCLGRSRELSTYQRMFKGTWKAVAKAKMSEWSYETNVENWQYNCGHQKYDAHHLCKHLVHAVNTESLSVSFWSEIHCCCTVPIYQHPLLCDKNAPSNLFTVDNLDDDSV